MQLQVTKVVAGVYAAANVLGTVPLGVDGQAPLRLSSLGAGTHSLIATYNGDANYSTSTATALSLVVDRASTSTLLTASFGAPFIAITSVAQPGAGTPTGFVQFFQGGVPIGTAPVLQLGQGFGATLPANSQTGTIRAIYQGDSNFSGSTSQAVTVVAGPAVSIASDRNPGIAGQPVTFTVQVTGAATGTVQFSSDGAALETVSLSGGRAILTATLAAGSHTILAAYSGDSAYSSGTATLLEVVNKPVVLLSLSSSLASTVYGQSVTFTAQLTGLAGTVQFADGLSPIGSAQTSGGVATLTMANLSPGVHSITAASAGDVSAALQQIVSRAQTSTSVLLSGLTLNAAVAVTAPGAGAPTGIVNFVGASTNSVLATAPLAGGLASAPLSSIAEPIVAVYSGDPNFQASTSLTQTPLVAANAASYATTAFAPDEIVTLFGLNLAAATVSGPAVPAASLGGTMVTVIDSAGSKHAGSVLFVSPTQASFLLPADIAPGSASVIVTNANRDSASTSMVIRTVAPGLFTLNGTGLGTPAGLFIRVHADGTQDGPQDLGVFDKVQGQWRPVPIDMGEPGDTVYLVLYATGIRHASITPVCTIAGQEIGVTFAGALGGFPGLDQVNVILPRSLQGAGTAAMTLTADGTASNAVTLTFQ